MKKLQTQYNEKYFKPDLPAKRLKDLNPDFIMNYMRNDYETYSIFYRTFIPSIVGKRFFGTTIKCLNQNPMKETDFVYLQ